MFEDEKEKYFEYKSTYTTYNYTLIDRGKNFLYLFNNINLKKFIFFKFFLNWLLFITEKSIFDCFYYE